jgi:hypothetical protein
MVSLDVLEISLVTDSRYEGEVRRTALGRERPVRVWIMVSKLT